MQFPRKLALGLAALAASLLVVLAVVPFLFRDRIASRLRAEINSSVNARVAWGRVGLSVLRDFPNVTLTLSDLSVAGIKPFERDTLVSVRDFRLVLDVASVIRNLRAGDQIIVREIELGQPALYLRVLKDGTANWDIARKPARTGSDDARGLALTLRQLQIHHGT